MSCCQTLDCLMRSCHSLRLIVIQQAEIIAPFMRILFWIFFCAFSLASLAECAEILSIIFFSSFRTFSKLEAEGHRFRSMYCVFAVLLTAKSEKYLISRKKIAFQRALYNTNVCMLCVLNLVCESVSFFSFSCEHFFFLFFLLF